MRIRKVILPSDMRETALVPMARGAEILCARRAWVADDPAHPASNGGWRIALYVREDPDALVVNRAVACAATGGDAPTFGAYLGGIFDGGNDLLHVFDMGEQA